MANTVTAPKGKPRELCPTGTHQAVCVKVIDLGTQPGSKLYPEEKHKYRLTFETSEEFNSDGEPFLLDKEYTFVDTNKSILRADWNSWLGRPNDDIAMGDFLNESALITVVHKKNDKGTYDNITTITGLPKGMKPKRAKHPLEELHLIDGLFDDEVFKKQPDWIRKKIEAAPEYKALIAVSPAPAEQRGKVKPSAQMASAQKAATGKKKK